MRSDRRQDDKGMESIPRGAGNGGHNRSDVPRGTMLQNELASISALINRLEKAMASLPHVNDEQESECPFAEDLYAQKEELEQELIPKAEVLKRYMVGLENEVQRCRNNLARIQADYAKLNLQETSAHYSEAIEAQLQLLRSATQDRDAVSIVLAKAEAVLKVSRTRKYPGRKPQRQYPFPGAKPGDMPKSSQLPNTPSTRGEPDDEVDGLISLGPLKQTQGSES